MSKTSKIQIKSWVVTLTAFALLVAPQAIFAQNIDLNDFKTAADEGIGVMKQIALAVLGLIILVSAGTLIWNLTQGNPQSKGGLIGFFGGIIIFIVVWQFFG